MPRQSSTTRCRVALAEVAKGVTGKRRTRPVVRWVGVLAGFLTGTVGGYLLAVSTGSNLHRALITMGLATAEGTILGYLGVPYVAAVLGRLNAILKTTPLPDLIGGVLGMICGLVVAALIGYFVREFPFGVPLSAILALLLGLLGANLGTTRRGELLAVLAGVRDAGEMDDSRIRGALVDTSVIIDGRILDLVRTGFVDYRLIVPRCVLRELQYVSDSADPLRRGRGRRGLDVLAEIQKEQDVRIDFTEEDLGGDSEVDAMLVQIARQRGYAILTNDFNLNRVARLQAVKVLNINDLANAMKVVAVPGEELTVAVVREGKEPGQGIAYLDDGTMVVVENGRRHLNQTISATVTSVLQTSAGRMIFAAPALAPDARHRRAEV